MPSFTMRPMVLPLLVTFLLVVCYNPSAMATPRPVLLSPLPNSHKPLPSSSATDEDHVALSSFRSHIRSDPSRALATWGNQSVAACQWRGVTCGRRGRRHGRVIALDLPGLGLLGTITPQLGSLVYLRRLHLPGNRLSGALPPELGNLRGLRHLDISDNSIGGQIPPSLANCRLLETMDLDRNRFQLEIPHQLGSLKNLKVLSLANNTLTGSIPPEVSNLVSLQFLDVSYNNLTGEIPSEIGRLYGILQIDLTSNQLTGPIPSTIGNLSALTYLCTESNKLTGGLAPLRGLSSISILQLGDNSLTGRIPSWLGNLSALTVVDFKKNGLVGIIPESIGNLKLLQVLSLSVNRLGGSIPNSLGNLHALMEVDIDNNELEGSIAPTVFNISSLQILNVQSNYLNGSFPLDLGSTLPNLELFLVNDNQFHGEIPATLCNTSVIQMIQMQANFLSRKIPNCFGIRQKYMSVLSFGQNQLEATNNADWSFLSSLTNSSNLNLLDVSRNKLQGELPDMIGNLSRNLFFLSVEVNNITGKIPEGIGNLIGLGELGLHNNLFEGNIPLSIGNLKSLNTLALSDNNLSGPIPVTLGNLTGLSELGLDGNALSGGIPLSLSRCPLEDLQLSRNRLTGPIPKELFLISTLSDFLLLDHNLLTGPLPSEVGKLRNIEAIDFSSNNISGEIPLSIGNCQSLQYLFISRNLLQGVIPLSVGQLNGLLELDLSHNNLSGTIPDFFGNMRGLAHLNLSFNYFEGEVPKDGIFLNTTAVSVVGNGGLCGGIPQLKLPLCARYPTDTHSRNNAKMISIVAGILFLASLVVLFSIIRWRSKPRREETHESLLGGQHLRISYAELANATNDFSSENLVGVGSFGSVYKGTMMNNGQHLVFAVKVFNIQVRGAFKSFDAECETLRCVRHRNLLKVLTVCSSTNFRGDDFKALIYEFMPNGNLHEWLHLHPEREGEKKLLDLFQRICIAIDVASALDYLHHHDPLPVIHCDLKPTNVLLDNDMVAQVCDFGLARFLHEDSGDILEQSTSWAAIRGTIGYIAPEYGQGNNASIQGDVYSFGILLLEMFTRKRPTDSEFIEGSNLQTYVGMSLLNQAIDVIDQHLLSTTEDDEGRTQDNQSIREKRIDCIITVLQIGIACSKELPADRMQIGDALKELLVTRDKYIRGS
ncbi:hypothetical protein BS78_01G229400 [Paspalum vaginatum]|nr:hypothetical protein BS78_01G229400 [Paspalum vaginatum]